MLLCDYYRIHIQLSLVIREESDDVTPNSESQSFAYPIKFEVEKEAVLFVFFRGFLFSLYNFVHCNRKIALSLANYLKRKFCRCGCFERPWQPGVSRRVSDTVDLNTAAVNFVYAFRSETGFVPLDFHQV